MPERLAALVAPWMVVIAVAAAQEAPAVLDPEACPEAAAILARRVEAREEERAGVEGAWEELSHEVRCDALRRALGSDDARLARFAAGELPWQQLSLEEVRRQARILAADPRVAPGSGEPPGFQSLGSAEYPALVRAVAEGGIEAFGAERFEDAHRLRLPEHLGDLVIALSLARDATWKAIFSQTLWQAWLSDDERSGVARALLLALDGIRAAGDGRDWPQWDAVQVPMGGPGLPGAFRRIATEAWRIGPADLPADPWTRALLEPPPLAWIHRWKRDVVPAAHDVPFLADAARGSEASSWAIRWLGRLATPGAFDSLRELAAGGSLDAAAVLARQGEPGIFAQLLAEAAPDEQPPLLWEIDREQARRRALAAIETGGAEFPGFAARFEIELDTGVRISDEDLAWIGERLLERAHKHPVVAARFFTAAWPQGLTAGAAARLARAFAGPAAVEAEAEISDQTLALLEVNALDDLLAMLGSWVRSGDDDARRRALTLLAVLGDTAHVEEALALWPEWRCARGSLAPAAGRLPGEAVESFLRARADGPHAPEALAALAVRAGFPERCAALFTGVESWFDDPHPAARAKILAGDPVGAALLLLDPGPEGGPIKHEHWVACLGLARDPRVAAFHRRLQSERHRGLYWEATAGLALAGEAGARSEFVALIADDRIAPLDELLDGHLLSLGGDEDLVRHWITRVGSNCCLWFHASVALRDGYCPWIPAGRDELTADYGAARRIAAAWFDLHRDRLAWSRILQARVPR